MDYQSQPIDWLISFQQTSAAAVHHLAVLSWVIIEFVRPEAGDTREEAMGENAGAQ